MRISWGHKIFVGYTLFVIGILFLVYKASKQNFDLVTENYYEAELKFQDVIDEKGRVALLSAPPKITHSVNSVSIQLPAEFAARQVSGEIYLYRPSDATKDIRKKFTSGNGFYQLEMPKELSGAYELKLVWEADGKRFLDEQRIFF